MREFGKWRTAADNLVVNNVQVTRQENLVTVIFEMKLPTIGAGYTLRYQLNGTGQLQTEATYTPLCDTIPGIPKFGMRLRVPENFNSIDWYGRGPYENYPDRKTGSLIGKYNSGLEDFITHYPCTPG